MSNRRYYNTKKVPISADRNSVRILGLSGRVHCRSTPGARTKRDFATAGLDLPDGIRPGKSTGGSHGMPATGAGRYLARHIRENPRGLRALVSGPSSTDARRMAGQTAASRQPRILQPVGFRRRPVRPFRTRHPSRRGANPPCIRADRRANGSLPAPASARVPESSAMT